MIIINTPWCLNCFAAGWEIVFDHGSGRFRHVHLLYVIIDGSKHTRKIKKRRIKMKNKKNMYERLLCMLENITGKQHTFAFTQEIVLKYTIFFFLFVYMHCTIL